jgi:hypothetical protein
LEVEKKGKLFSDAHLITSKGSMNFGYQEVKFLIYEVGRSRKSIKIKSFHGARLSPSPSLSLSLPRGARAVAVHRQLISSLLYFSLPSGQA